MKKRIMFVAVTVLVLLLAFSTVLASANSIGDVDGDGSITAADARLALRASVKLETLTDAQTKAADVDGQPGITAADARLILRASVKLEELKDPHTHSFTGTVTKAATCTAEGVKTFTCECGEGTYTEKIPATGHSYDKGIVTLPTCTAEGYTTYTCSSCKHSYNADTIKAKGHTEVKDKAVAATCTKTGLTEGKHCSVCGTVLTAQSVVPATGHNMKETAKAVAATCTVNGKTAVFTCANNCGKTEGGTTVPATGHDMKETAKAVEPTCTVNGKTAVFTCANNCGKTEGGTTVPATGHDMKETAKAVEPTCTVNGKTAVLTCANNCGKTEGGDTVPATGHALTQVEAKPAACEAIGWNAYEYCSECDYTTYEEIPATGHNMQKTADAVPPTCTEDGKTEVLTCANNCGKTEGGATVSATGHDMKETAKAVAPTCTENGKTAVFTCANNCGKTEGGATVSATGHDMKETAKAVAPTCTVNGKTAVLTCANNCGKTEGGDTVPATGHALTQVEAKPAACEAIGWNAYEYCSEGDYTTYEEIPATGHNMQKTADAVPPTCTEDGKTEVLTCANNCGKTEGGATVSATGHDMKETAKAVAPTCTVDGKTAVLTCANNCGKTEGGDTVPATGHTLTQVEAQAPDCTEIGWNAYEYCSECDYTTYEEIPALGHSTTEEGDKEPSCTEPGYCTRCETELPAIATGHDLVYKEVNHTCFDDGYTVYICTRCDYYKDLQTPDHLKAPGYHSFDEENIKVVAATCTTQGYKEKTCTASYWLENEEGVLELMPCGVTEKFDIVDELGHSLSWETNEEASCTATGLKTGTCTRDNCNYTTTEIIPLKAHSPSDTAITVPGEGDTYCKLVIECTVCHAVLQEDSTQGHRIEFEYDYVEEDEICTTDATGTKRCIVCNYVEENVLIAKATGHEGNITNYTPATCTENGYAEIGYCTTCNKEINGGFVIYATGHTTSGIATCTTDVRCMICNEVVEERLGHNFKVRALAYNTDIDQFFCTRCGAATEDTLDTFNSLANSIKGTYFRDHFNNPKNGSDRIELIRFSKTKANTTYSRFDFGIYTNTIKDLYDDEMAKNTDNYTPVRTTGTLKNMLPLTYTGVVSLLEAGDIEASNGIKAEKLNSLNVRDVLSAYADTYTVGEKNYDISSYKKVIDEEVIKVTVNVKNEKYSQIKTLPNNQRTALEKVLDLDIRDDVKEFKDVNGRLILEEQDKGEGYEITMSMELLEIESDATVTYYFAADTYEPILAVYNADITMDQTIDMTFKIGLFSLKGEIDPVITTNYSYVYLFPNFFA